MTWLSWIINLLHQATVVTKMLLWSRSSNHDRSLNELQFPLHIFQRKHIGYSVCLSLGGIKRNKTFTTRGENEWGNTNVNSSIYIIRVKFEFGLFEGSLDDRVHNSTETWPQLGLLPFYLHPPQKYFMSHHLWSKSRVWFLSRRFPLWLMSFRRTLPVGSIYSSWMVWFKLHQKAEHLTLMHLALCQRWSVC